MSDNLLNKVWKKHKIKTLETGQDQLFISLHLIHEVTSPQAFGMLEERGLNVLYPERTFGTVDHIIPTDKRERPFDDQLAENMIQALEDNTSKNKITYYGPESEHQGIVHIMGPELGLTQPGLTIACGDSHTSTHGAFGAIAFGIGTSQIRDILATQTMAISKPKVRNIKITGSLQPGVYAKDIILKIIADLGVNGGIGYAYEYSGAVINQMSMEERMTICNMTIEGGARVGYINPDETTFEYLKNRPYSPVNFDESVQQWKELASGADAQYDDEYTLNADTLEPMVTWGINPGHAIGISEKIPLIEDLPVEQRQTAEQACTFMGFEPGQAIKGTKIDVAFIGSCTNGRISDLRLVAELVKGKKVAPSVRALIVPGSRAVAKEAEKEGLHIVFRDAGFQWREPGCSMCLAMNPDKLKGSELSVSSSNRNFIGRQGSPTGRTILMSPVMVAAAAIKGEICDSRGLS
ncbi:MAG: 3-isopropylmalate dehydratase large subunit [Spirochaetaceae bacterium]|jgi:3-isopropylmalate/(R)-2-methylmalate dehydratase large subunit|nr:3-isopropylmalate dehydratase large subunit [Spirochaetaceae bacterium]